MAKKTKTAKAAKSGKGKKRKAGASAGRTAGSAGGLTVLAYACVALIGGNIDLFTAGKLAVGALIGSIIIEKAVFPLGLTLMGPPAVEEEPDEPQPGRRTGR